MDAVDFIALTFAASAIVDAWKNGSIFATGRAFMQAKEDYDGDSTDEDDEDDEPIVGEQTTWSAWLLVPRFFAEMLNCAFCTSHHTPWVLALVFYFPSLFVISPWDFLLKLPIYSLAATRLGTIINAYVPREARYDRDEMFTANQEEDNE